MRKPEQSRMAMEAKKGRSVETVARPAPSSSVEEAEPTPSVSTFKQPEGNWQVRVAVWIF